MLYLVSHGGRTPSDLFSETCHLGLENNEQRTRELYNTLLNLFQNANKQQIFLFMFRFPPDTPRTPIVSMAPTHNILEGDQVTVMCRSDANPPASFRWFKGNQPLAHNLPKTYVIHSVQSSDSRQYSCRAENQLGGSTSQILIDVKCEDLKCVQL